MSKQGERKPRRKVPVNPKPLEFKEVTATIKVPNKSPQARKIHYVISALWPRAVVCRTTLQGILARLELVGMHLSCQASEGDNRVRIWKSQKLLLAM